MKKVFHVGRFSFRAHVRERLARFWDLVEQGRWEPATFEAFERYIRPGCAFADIGAWIGSTALFAAHIASEVHAFEPDPAAFATLTANLDLNPELAPRIRAINAAVADFEGELPMAAPGRQGMSETSSLLAGAGETFTAPALDAAKLFANGLSHVEFVKMDIEGGEYATIPAMKQFLEDRKPVVLLSLHPRNLGIGLAEAERTSLVEHKTTAVLDAFRGYGRVQTVTSREILPAPAVERYFEKGEYADAGESLLFLP
ncbi:FkbM family methyltransferase [Salidesulfovibrio onnuriiensis]|uniref:FkbM family methyltransferase n=1 Tax=Salidesulfovibrio onnuriiensis TaxID=2583823 RepID=UPI0011C89EB8|nr:FkbM family methyltransferase [Salidesulfovibrio onnuriiensis]